MESLVSEKVGIVVATRIILVRHGETQWNEEQRVQGQLDAALNERGYDQAIRLAVRLKAENFRVIYTSDLQRCYVAAEIIKGRRRAKIVKCVSLREVGFGEWEGLLLSEIEERYSELYVHYRQDPIRYRPVGAERLGELYDRVNRAIDEIIEGHPDETVVVVTHGGPIRMVVRRALGLGVWSPKHFAVDNGSLSIVVFGSDGTAFLELLNDSCHLTTDYTDYTDLL